MSEPADSQEERVCSDIVALLQAEFNAKTESSIAMMADNYTKWSLQHPVSSMLVHLIDREPADAVRDEITIGVYLFIRKYKGKDGVTVFQKRMRKTLRNKRIPNGADKLLYIGDYYRGEQDGVWAYLQQYRLKIKQDDD